MRRNTFNKIWRLFFCVTLLTFLATTLAIGSEQENTLSFGELGEYGSIYGAEYDPEHGNTSKWLTIKPGENGIRIINDGNVDIFMVDKYGGVYVNGQFYVNGEQYIPAKSGKFSPENGFLYFMIVLSLCFNLYLYSQIKKKGKLL